MGDRQDKLSINIYGFKPFFASLQTKRFPLALFKAQESEAKTLQAISADKTREIKRKRLNLGVISEYQKMVFVKTILNLELAQKREMTKDKSGNP